VTGRATRFAYGIKMRQHHEPSNGLHDGRKVQHVFDGDFVYGVWGEIIDKASSLDIFWLDASLSLKAGSHFRVQQIEAQALLPNVPLRKAIPRGV
jgi:hypothetical protein